MHSWAIRASLLLLPGATCWTSFHRKIILLHAGSLLCYVYFIFFLKQNVFLMSRRIRDIWWSCVQVESCKSHKTTPPPFLKKRRKLTQMQTCTLLLTFVCIKRIWGTGTASVDSAAVRRKKVFLLQLLYKHTSCSSPSVCFHGYLFTCLHLRAALQLFLCYVENLSFILSS